jgi:hypothetical protein
MIQIDDLDTWNADRRWLYLSWAELDQLADSTSKLCQVAEKLESRKCKNASDRDNQSLISI